MPNTGGNANIAPVAANGKVYVASYKGLAIFGLSNQSAATIPATLTSFVAARAPLPAGQHEIFGTVGAIKGQTITIFDRRGKYVLLKVDTAIQAKNFAQPRLGAGILARGSYNRDGSLEATVVMHAKDHPSMWLSDR